VTAPRRLLLLVLIPALIAAGCGGESDEEQVRSTLERFADATAKKDYQVLCDELFATKLVEEVRRQVACELALKNSSLGEAQQPKLEIKRIKIESDSKASAVVRTSAANQKPSEDTVELIREGDDWRIISLSSG
jgi:hypothetical protein